MSGNNQLTTALSGATSTAAGVAILPNTNGNITLMILAIILVTAGALTLASFAAMKIAGKISNK